MDNKSIHGEQVRLDILKAGVVLWRNGAEKVTARGVGQILGLTHAGVLYHFKSSDKLRAAVAEYAVEVRDPIVVPQLIVINHPSTVSLTPDDRRTFLNAV